MMGMKKTERRDWEEKWFGVAMFALNRSSHRWRLPRFGWGSKYRIALRSGDILGIGDPWLKLALSFFLLAYTLLNL